MSQARDRGFADALRAAIEARGLSLDRVRAHLLSYGHDVSVATLSYWQTGRSMPVRRSSVQALGALEVILQVPRGSLASKLPSHAGRKADRADVVPSFRPMPFQESDRIMTRMGLKWFDGYQVVSQQEDWEIGPDRSVLGHTVTEVIIAERDGFDRFAVAYVSDVPGVLMEITALHGCQVGRVAHVLRETLTVAELILEHPLRAGDPYLTKHAISYDTEGVHIRGWHRDHLLRTRVASLSVRFPADDLPESFLAYTGPMTEDPAYVPLELRSHEVTMAAQDFGPGLLSVQWGWSDDPEEFIQPVRELSPTGVVLGETVPGETVRG